MRKGIIDLRKRSAGLSSVRARRLSEASGRRKSPLRARRRKKQIIFFFIFCVLVGVFVGGLSLLSYHPRLLVQSISVVGAKDIPEKQILRFVESTLFNGSNSFFARQNIYLFPSEEILEGLKTRFPRIKSADLSRDSFTGQALTLTILERGARAHWCSDTDGCFLMDDAGFIFAQATTAARMLVFNGPLFDASAPIGQIFLAAHMRTTLEFAERLQWKGFEPERIVVEDSRDYSIHLAEGFILRSSFTDSPVALIRNLELIMASAPLRDKEASLEYVDLRFGNRVYYKLEGRAAAEAGQ